MNLQPVLVQFHFVPKSSLKICTRRIHKSTNDARIMNKTDKITALHFQKLGPYIILTGFLYFIL